MSQFTPSTMYVPGLIVRLGDKGLYLLNHLPALHFKNKVFSV